MMEFKDETRCGCKLLVTFVLGTFRWCIYGPDGMTIMRGFKSDFNDAIDEMQKELSTMMVYEIVTWKLDADGHRTKNHQDSENAIRFANAMEIVREQAADYGCASLYEWKREAGRPIGRKMFTIYNRTMC